jgi:putative flippase GtrA
MKSNFDIKRLHINLYKYFKIGFELEKIRYLIVGTINTIFGIGVYPFLYLLFDFWKNHYLYLMLVCWILSTTFSFITNRNIVFRSTSSYISQYLKYIPYHLVNLLLNWILLYFMTNFLNLSPLICQLVIGIISAFLGYLWYSRFVFIKQ